MDADRRARTGAPPPMPRASRPAPPPAALGTPSFLFAAERRAICFCCAPVALFVRSSNNAVGRQSVDWWVGLRAQRSDARSVEGAGGGASRRPVLFGMLRMAGERWGGGGGAFKGNWLSVSIPLNNHCIPL